MTNNDELWDAVVDNLRKEDVYAVVVPKEHFDSTEEVKDFKQMATPDLKVDDNVNDLRVTVPGKPEVVGKRAVRIDKGDEKKSKKA